MALEIFKLVGSIFIDTDKANDSLQKTDKKAASVAEGLGKVFTPIISAILTRLVQLLILTIVCGICF